MWAFIVVALHCAVLAVVFAWFLKATLAKYGVSSVKYLQMLRLTVESAVPVFLADSMLAAAGVWQMLSDWSMQGRLSSIAANAGIFVLSTAGYLLMFYTMRSGFKRRHITLGKVLPVSFERIFVITALKALLPVIVLALAISSPIAFLLSGR